VDCGLILGKDKGLFVKLAGIIGLELFSNGKRAWTQSIAHGPRLQTVHRGPRIVPWRGARRSLTSGPSGAREFTGEGATERGEHGESVSGLTRARAAVWQPDNGGAGAQRQRRLISEGRGK
jgi:hypothetical protein